MTLVAAGSSELALVPGKDLARAEKDFNNEVKHALDWTLFSLAGPNVVTALYQNLREHHGITPEKVPYNLETVVAILESVYGEKGVGTIERMVAKRLYSMYSLKFVPAPNSNFKTT